MPAKGSVIGRIGSAVKLIRHGYRPLNGGIAHRSVERFGTVEVGRGVLLQKHVTLDAGHGETIRLAERVTMCVGTCLATLGGDIEVGPGSFMNSYCVVLAAGPVKIGSGVLFGPHVVVAAGSHGFEGRRPVTEQPITGKGVTIEDEVWVGAHATIVDGVTVARGAVVAAGAVVTRDAPPFSIVAGVPARVVRYREGCEPV